MDQRLCQGRPGRKDLGTWGSPGTPNPTHFPSTERGNIIPQDLSTHQFNKHARSLPLPCTLMSSKSSSSRGKEKINASTSSSTNTNTNTNATTISLVVTNVRLLGLVQRDDWPNIYEQSLLSESSAQSYERNIRFVEWILYRLFEIWDVDLTKEVSGYTDLCEAWEPKRSDADLDHRNFSPSSRH